MRLASTLFLPDVQVGEYVLLSAGTLVDRISAEEAQERLSLFADLLDAMEDAEAPPA